LRRCPSGYKCNVETIIGPDDELLWPSYTDQFDFELELGFFTSGGGRDLSPREAGRRIAGITMGIHQVRDYLVWVQDEARACHEKGMTPEEAMRAINLGRFAKLDEHARIAQNVLAAYYELGPTLARVDTIEVFRRMAGLEGFTE
jgi:hypothetical protein